MSTLASSKKSLTFQSDKHDPQLFHNAGENQNEHLCNDVTINAGGQSIPASKMVLSCYSEFFKTMFASNMNNGPQNRVEINGFHGHIIKLLIDYIYTGAITIDNENVMSILGASEYLQLDAVKEFCFEYLESELAPGNCMDILCASVFNTSAQLPQSCQTLSENFEKVSQTQKFKLFFKADLMSIIEKLNEMKANETAKYHAIMNWTKHEPETRRKEFTDLFHLLDANKLSLGFLKDVVATDPLMQGHPACLKVEYKLLCVGGNTRGELVEFSDKFVKTSKIFPKLPTDALNYGVIKVNNFIYCIGGKVKRYSDSDKVFRIDLSERTLKWNEIAPMNHARSNMGCAVFDNKLIVTGGNGQDMDSTEFYDEESNEWRLLRCCLNETRHGNALVACQSRLYAIGGFGISSVECLSDLYATWKSANPMNWRRGLPAAASYGGLIYAFGGTEWNAQNSVEKYNPDENQWTVVKPMKFERVGHAACVLGDKILVVGGMKAEHKYVHEVECYDPANDTWCIVGKIDADLYGHALVVV